MSSTLFSDAVCDCLLNNIEHDPDMTCKVFSIIALEKFSLTGPCKARIMQTPIRRLLQDISNLSADGLVDQEEISGVLQAKFCADWSLRNIFRDVTEESKSIVDTEMMSDHSSLRAQEEETLHRRNGSGVQEAGSEGPSINVMLNTLDATGHWKISEDGLSIRNDGSTFESIRATKSVTQGKWYYEVTLVTAGIMQLGWATIHCQFSPEDGTGVGDDIFGFAYDGCRNLIWADGESQPYGVDDSWKSGDVIGLYLDIDNAKMECFKNGESLGQATPFATDHFGIQAISGFYPALSFTSFQQAKVNFGATPFRYPPSLAWRNINDHGTITTEMRQAIIRPRNDSVYGRIHVDPVTGIRLPSMPEDDGEIDYSLLCTICCDHTATVTLQPCGHDGLCVECAYSLDMCPLCRSRIFQRQMFSSSEAKEGGSNSGGLGISGLAGSDISSSGSINSSQPGLSTSTSTTTSTWSAEYCGPAPALASNHLHLEEGSGAAAAAAAMVAAAAVAEATREQHPLNDAHSRRRNTVSLPSSSSSRVTLDGDRPEDPFSPPSTAYFAFLNRPPRIQRSQLQHSMEMDPLATAPALVTIQENQAFTQSLFVPPSPPSLGEEEDDEDQEEEDSAGPLNEGPALGFGLGLGSGFNTMDGSDFGSEIEEDEEDLSNGLDVVLVEEGREASDSELMEQSAPDDFGEGHSIHSRRSSMQVFSGSLPPIGGGLGPGSLPTSTIMSSVPMGEAAATAPAVGPGSMPMTLTPTTVEELTRLVNAIPLTNAGAAMGGASASVASSNTGNGAGRFGGRRASMPSNRLEM
ncbi:RING finger and SPRY domain-containing protein 1 [Dissophora globulifera]|nr:RING finger and SPRY domain-containing protein 1 [Dissophora globulifera]